MVDAATLELPEFDPTDVTLNGQRFHETMADLAARSWLARVPLGYLTLDREAGEFFLRSRRATFPGQLIAELFGVGPGPLREEIDNNILHLDGDRHRRLRGLLNPFFTPRAVDRWRPMMRTVLDDLYAGIAHRGSCEFVASVAKPYPSRTIAAVMGAPESDAAKLHEWSHWMQSQFDGPSLLNDRDRIEAAVREFYEWCGELIERRRDDPGDDLVSVLIAAEEAGDRLSEVELRNLVLDVLAGGVDTTQSQLAHGIRLFAEHPEQWALLADRPDLLEPAVDEVLRHEPVTPISARVLTDTVEFRDVEFPSGTVILVGSFTGNRDAAGTAIVDLAAFDITADRSAARIMTFGAGIHFCVGANLARAELAEAFGYLAPRLPELHLTGPSSFGTVQGIYGLDALPVGWRKTG